jgi:hypothetical protein
MPECVVVVFSAHWAFSIFECNIYIELFYSYRALAYRLAILIVITVIYKVEILYGTYSIVVTEETIENAYIFNFFL